MRKDFDAVVNESTCQKRVVVCELFDANGILLARESNRCAPDGGRCHRLSTVHDKGSYPENSECNWTHAERMALNSLPDGATPVKAVIYGHSFACNACEVALKAAGISIILIEPSLLTTKISNTCG